jgi:hypothetical protein
MHFIVDSGIQKNLISAEVVKQTHLAENATPTTLHHWMALPRKRSPHHPIVLNCRTTSSPSKTRCCVMFLLSKFVMFFWDNIIYGNIMLYMMSRPHSVIITLNRKLYRIPEAVPPSVISLISAKQCRNVISLTRKFYLLHDSLLE